MSFIRKKTVYECEGKIFDTEAEAKDFASSLAAKKYEEMIHRRDVLSHTVNYYKDFRLPHLVAQLNECINSKDYMWLTNIASYLGDGQYVLNMSIFSVKFTLNDTEKLKVLRQFFISFRKLSLQEEIAKYREKRKELNIVNNTIRANKV